MRRLTRITIDEREKFRLSVSSCENRDVGPLMWGILRYVVHLYSTLETFSKGVDRERGGV